MDANQLLRIMPNAKQHVSKFLEHINAVMVQYNINTIERQAAFLAQIAHESGDLSSVRENLNYSPEALMATFNTSKLTRFTKTTANQYGRTKEHPADQRAIANIAYANRMGNGPASSDDGWNFRGGGLGQLTGRNNYTKCGKSIRVDLANKPEWIERPDVGVLAFGWFWNEGNPTGRDLNILADTGEIDRVSWAVNGGDNGLDERAALYRRALGVLG